MFTLYSRRSRQPRLRPTWTKRDKRETYYIAGERDWQTRHAVVAMDAGSDF